jgi:hypothetical protein
MAALSLSGEGQRRDLSLATAAVTEWPSQWSISLKCRPGANSAITWSNTARGGICYIGVTTLPFAFGTVLWYWYRTLVLVLWQPDSLQSRGRALASQWVELAEFGDKRGGCEIAASTPKNAQGVQE